MNHHKGRIYEFSEFRLIPAENLLLRDGRPVQLAPKAFSTLVMLVEEQGHLVEKNELIARVWEDSFVEEGAISKCIWAIRNAIGDDSKDQRFIQTVPKRGYRFVGEVKTLGAVSDLKVVEPSGRSPKPFPSNVHPMAHSPVNSGGLAAVAVESAEEPAVPFPAFDTDSKPNIRIVPSRAQRPSRRMYYLSAALVALIVGAFAAYRYIPAGTAASDPGRKQIAVLPLKPVDSDSRDDIYEIGIADSLILKLSSVNGILVRPLSAVRKYTDLEQDPIAAGKEQQVDYVLVANYQTAQGKIRITAQLFNVLTGRIEDTYKSERVADNVFAVQDAVADDIGNVLLSHFGAIQTELIAKRGTENEEAYRLYLRARYLTESRMLPDAEKAVELSEEAIRLDPNYARAWAINAQAHVFKTLVSRKVDPHEENRQAMRSIEKAMVLDPNLSDTYSVLCEAQRSYSWDLAAAERSCNRAIELDPMSALARQANTRLLATLGRSAESVAEAKVAIDIEPASFIAQRHYGGALYFDRRYDDAITHFLRTIELSPTTGSLNYGFLINSYALKHDYPSAFEWFMKLKSIENTDQQTLAAYRSAYQSGGWRGVLNEDANRFDEEDGTYFLGAILNGELDRKDKAFEYLEKAFHRREWQCVWITIEPRLDPLRDDPRFADFVKRLQMK